MTARMLFRDGENLADAMVRRMVSLAGDSLFAVPAGVGTGYSAGSVGAYNLAAGANPNHFAVIADGVTRVLTIRPGWASVQKDSGLTTFDPQSHWASIDANSTVTIAANATGSTRNDTICLRIDQTTAPDATGSNLVTIVIVQGAAGGGLSNAPADGALYMVLANIAVLNGTAFIDQAHVTDLRSYVLGDTGWIQVSGGVGFQNAWVDFGGGNPNAAYRRIGNVVRMRGIIKTGTIGLAAFTLPLGFRPIVQQGFACPSNSAFGFLSVTNAALGTVIPNAGSNVFFYLDSSWTID